jgi:hypothetical protein
MRTFRIFLLAKLLCAVASSQEPYVVSISLPQVSKAPPSADCGPCTLCCDAIGVPDLGKPFYARCSHLQEHCGIYETRPQACRAYRCAWHLGILGERVDRRPDHVGVLFQFELLEGKWHLGIYEVIPGSLGSDRVNYLRDIILASKKIAHLSMGSPAVRVYPWGSDIPPEYPIAKEYSHYDPPSPPTLLRRDGSQYAFAGQRRDFLMPNSRPQVDVTLPQGDSAAETHISPPASQ